MRQAIQLDFAGHRRGLSWPGAVLLVLGLAAAAGVAIDYRIQAQHRSALELKLAALTRANSPSSGQHDAAADGPAAVNAQRAAVDLATPWTRLLAELEQASKESRGQVALLGVEPDHGKHSVRVAAEARTLALAIAYAERLQSSHSLEYPMLDRHEIRADDAQHPVRFELTGDWKDLP